MKNFKEINRTFTVEKTKFLKRVFWLVIPLLTMFNSSAWGVQSSEVASTKSTSITDGDLYIIATKNTGGYFLTSTVSSNWGVVSTTLSDAAVFTAHGNSSGFYLTCPAGRLVPSTGNFQAYDQNTGNNLSLNTTNGQIQNSSSTSYVLQSNNSSYNARWYSSSQTDFYLFKVTLSPKTLTYNAGTGTCKSSDTEASGGAGIVLPSATPSDICTAGGWVFAGWKRTSAQTTTTTIPALYKAGTRYYPDADETLYAVYRNGYYEEIDFESETSAYTDWTFTTITSQKSTITANTGLYYGNTDGKSSGSIETKSTIAAPKDIKCYVSKESTNTTSSTWNVYTKAPDGDWTLRNSEDATDMGKGEWKSFHVDLSSYTNVYVKIAYSGSTAIRAIDDVILSSATFNSSPDCTYDWFVDIMHDTEIDPVQGSYAMPSPGDADKGDEHCDDKHYHFMGWVEDTYVKEDGTLDTEAVGYTLYPAGDAGHTANNKTFYAIWAKEE